MAISMSIYDTATLVETVQSLKQPSQFLLDLFFSNAREFDSREVAIDVDVGKRRLAPFVSPLVQGKPVEARGVTTSLFAPAYIKDKRPLDPMRPVMRAIGERVGGVLSAEDREMANIGFEMTDQLQMINRRLEWMAANVLLTGTVTITGDGYPSQLVNFGRDSALTVTLSGASAWTATNVGTAVAPGAVSPADNVESWGDLVLQKSGAVVTDVVFTPTAWSIFLRDQSVHNSIWLPRAGRSTIDLGAEITVGGSYKGRWGEYRLWRYNDWYVDSVTDVEHPMLPDPTVLLLSTELQGVRAFGAIMDPEFAYGALAYAPKSWITPDPAQRWLMMQSAPLVIPSRVNASMAVTVSS